MGVVSLAIFCAKAKTKTKHVQIAVFFLSYVEYMPTGYILMRLELPTFFDHDFTCRHCSSDFYIKVTISSKSFSVLCSCALYVAEILPNHTGPSFVSIVYILSDYTTTWVLSQSRVFAFMQLSCVCSGLVMATFRHQ